MTITFNLRNKTFILGFIDYLLQIYKLIPLNHVTFKRWYEVTFSFCLESSITLRCKIIISPLIEMRGWSTQYGRSNQVLNRFCPLHVLNSVRLAVSFLSSSWSVPCRDHQSRALPVSRRQEWDGLSRRKHWSALVLRGIWERIRKAPGVLD